MQDINSNGLPVKGINEKGQAADGRIHRPATSKESFVNGRKHFCTYCMLDVEWVTVREAAAVFNTDAQDIVYLIERSELHVRTGISEPLFVCRNSLFDCFERRKTRLLDSHFELAISQSSFSVECD